MDLMRCNYCGDRLAGANPDSLFYCDAECEQAKKDRDVEMRAEEAKTHSPWNRWSEDTRAEMKAQMGISGPFKWTEAILAAAAVETGDGEPKLRADGEIDGRAAGNRKCGKCGESGHNARTCSVHQAKANRGQLVAAMGPSAPAIVSGASAAAPTVMGQAMRSPVLPGSPVAAPRMAAVTSDDIPAPRLRSESQTPTRAGAEPKLKTCGKCGGKGHNARTCGLPKKIEIGSGGAHAARGGYICGKCGQSGHNARTCKG